MKIILLSVLLLSGCGRIEPPSDAAIAAASQNCTSQNRQVSVFYNGLSYNIECK